MDEGILIEDDEGYITFANPWMLEMVGLSKGDLIGRHWSEIFAGEYETEIRDNNSRVQAGERVRFEAALDLKDREMQVMVSATPLKKDDIYAGNLKVFVDITERKEAEERLRYRALKYKIENGKGYLVVEKDLKKGMDVFTDMIQAEYKGLAIGREFSEEFLKRAGKDCKLLWLGKKKKGKGTMAPQLNLVSKAVEDFASRNRVILLDRLDYLAVHNSFNDMLKLLQELNEIMHMSKAVLLVVVDPDTFSKEEFGRLRKELQKIISKYPVKLDNNLLRILEFIDNENSAGRVPVYKDISRAFSITRPTTLKRLNELKNKGLLVDKKKGRFKVLELTERGREAL
jgi:PAS domain S-box-containing protein